MLYRETHSLLDDLADATLDGTRKEIIMRRYERASTMLTSNRPVEDWGKLLGDAAAATVSAKICFCTRQGACATGCAAHSGLRH